MTLMLSSSQFEQLRQRTNKNLCKIIRTNFNTQFAQASPKLADFRTAVAGLLGGVTDGDSDTQISDSFRKMVQLTTYDSYAPYIARLLERPCKASAITDLLAPGLPDYITESSSTSGGKSKTIPKYNIHSKFRHLSSRRGSKTTETAPRRANAYLWHLWNDPVQVEDEGCPVKKLYVSSSSALGQRMILILDPEDDEAKMGTFVFDHAAPYATGFIRKWQPFLLIHALFAMSSRSLESMSMAFINTLVDMMHHIDAEFNMLLDCIARGTIPALDGIEEVRSYLEPNLLPDPERAEELRLLGPPSCHEGWCGRVWPNLSSVTSIASGHFASSLPLAEWYLGSNVVILPGVYASTESSMIGIPCSRETFKLASGNIVEFLDFTKNDSISSLSQVWEVEVGKQYEMVITTPNGLWRYRQADVVEVSGFDTTDGVPILKFVERLNTVIRFPDFMVTEKELRAAMSMIPEKLLVNIVDWVATIDNRQAPATIGFFVELASKFSDLPSESLDFVLDELLRSNLNIRWAVDHKSFGKPTIRLVRPGTFSEFRQLKLDEGSSNVGQIKVPVVLPKATYVTWFSDRVTHEL